MEGRSETISISLTAPLKGRLQLGLESNNRRLRFKPTLIEFGPSSWDQPKSVKVIGIDDKKNTGVEEAKGTVRILSSEDIDYSFVAPVELDITMVEQGAKGKLVVTVAPENRNATLIVDGEYRFPLEGKLRPSLKMAAGMYSVQLEQGELFSKTQQVRIDAGKTSRIVFERLEHNIQKPAITDEESSDEWKWHAWTLGLTALVMLEARFASDEFNKLSKENEQLSDSYSTTGNTSSKDQYESNQRKMQDMKSWIQMMDLLSIVGLGFEAYLLMSSKKDDVASKGGGAPLYIAWYPRAINLHWNWNF